jgi:coronin-7
MRREAPSYSLVCPQIFSLAWSPDGKQLATVCKDGHVRVYEPRSSPLPLQVSMLDLGQRQS